MENYDNIYITVHGWITHRLGLTRDNKDVYAVIYGVTKDGAEEFYASADYVAELLGISVAAVYRAIKNLVAQKVILRTKAPVNGCISSVTYRVNTAKLDFLAATVKTETATIGAAIKTAPPKGDNKNKNINNNITRACAGEDVEMIKWKTLHKIIQDNFVPRPPQSAQIIHDYFTLHTLDEIRATTPETLCAIQGIPWNAETQNREKIERQRIQASLDELFGNSPYFSKKGVRVKV